MSLVFGSKFSVFFLVAVLSFFVWGVLNTVVFAQVPAGCGGVGNPCCISGAPQCASGGQCSGGLCVPSSTGSGGTGSSGTGSGGTGGSGTGSGGTQPSVAPIKLPDPLKDKGWVDVVRLISDALKLLGIPIATLFFLWAGFLFITARGNEEQRERGKKAFWWTVVGTALLIGAIVLAGALVNYMQTTL
jgi:hypothetical protein